jgi:hypothetical protein
MFSVVVIIGTQILDWVTFNDLCEARSYAKLCEEFQRLFQTGTLRPILYTDIPADNVVTYVNPVCSEKVNDDESIKFRTRLTIGGDRINYPFDKSAETVDLEAVKLLLNCMISEDANWSTIDLTDF